MDLLDKQILRPSLETQDLQLIKADDGNRYMIVTSDDSDLTIGNTIVTKQNTDGTISFTSIAGDFFLLRHLHLKFLLMFNVQCTFIFIFPTVS